MKLMNPVVREQIIDLLEEEIYNLKSISLLTNGSDPELEAQIGDVDDFIRKLKNDKT